MTRWLGILASLGLAACDERAPSLVAYRKPLDAAASVLPLSWFGVYRCATLVDEGGTKIISRIPVDQCYKMLPARHYRGIWVDEFEGSTFFENANDVQAVKARMNNPDIDREWLDWARHVGDELPKRTSPNSRMVAIDFIGRRTAYPGRYGHLGGSRTEILVDRVIAARSIYESETPYLSDEAPPVPGAPK